MSRWEVSSSKARASWLAKTSPRISSEPGNASSGAFVELEARCYGEAGTEIGYIQLEKRWQADASKSIYIFGPAPEDGSGNFDCLEGDTETGQVPCVWSPLLE